MPCKACMYVNTFGCICILIFFFLPFSIHNTALGQLVIVISQAEREAERESNESVEPWETTTTTDCFEIRWFHLTGNYSRNFIRDAIFLPSARALWGRQVDGLREAKRVAGEVATCLFVAHLLDLKASVAAAAWRTCGFPHEAPRFTEAPDVSE